uniref:P-loop containing nucleoside triphosphate hydrolase protein n=1 Tax=Mycena chlorophos TaxID=658473 RepID=A0ABQ0L4Q7_MYCCL|nr:predicted protein [Mycena chlorophos]
MSNQAPSDANASVPPWMTSFLGLSSVFAAVGMLSGAYLGSSVKLLILGSLIETGRRVFQWLIVRLRFQYSITAQFDEGDPAYEWIVLFLTQENVWERSREFVVNATNSRRKWAVKTWADPRIKGHAEYVPTYHEPQLFRWRGRWVEIKRSREGNETRFTSAGTFRQIASILVTMYTLDMSLMSDLVEDAHARYVEVNKPNVVIHIADSPQYGPGLPWTSVKHKMRRPLSTIILPEGVIDALVRDAQEFIASENWYVEAGIPHRRGYLLYGPPGTGKTSTIYALAGALNLEIYSLSLASSFVDDSFLQRAASAIPKNALFLIEDIDCAFPSRDDEEELAERQAALMSNASASNSGVSMGGGSGRSLVTLSGLLNVIDGVGSEEGKLFFATTNYIDRLDPALLRPGRIDHKVLYEMATAEQATALFLRFFPPARFSELVATPDEKNGDAKDDSGQASKAAEGPTKLDELATEFGSKIPPREFTTAELQGYLQGHKTTPELAAANAGVWVEDVRAERAARKKREAEREQRVKEKREKLIKEKEDREWEREKERKKEREKEREKEEKEKEAGTVQDDKTVDQKPQVKDETTQVGNASPAKSAGSEFSSYADGALPAE